MPSGTTSGGGLQQEIRNVISEILKLRVAELKKLCKSLSLTQSGLKSDLQDRIVEYVKGSMSIGYIDPWRPKTISALIRLVNDGEELPKFEQLWQEVKTGNISNSSSQNGKPAITTLTLKNSPNNTAPFKLSPFYNLIRLIPQTVQPLPTRSGRGTASTRFAFNAKDWEMLQSGKNYKVFLFCHENKSQSSVKQFIEFPHPNEILFNGRKITDNVRGLKNKPGTAKPADLTPFIKPPNQMNALELVYAFSTVEYKMCCYVVETVTPEKLLEQVLAHPKISKQETVKFIKKTLNEEDDDIVTTSTILSLQCPISYTRMKYPAKSRLCKHLQCFDALWYLHSQTQIPIWQCPVCQSNIPLEKLTVSEYVDDILKNSNEDVEQVELSTNGDWHAIEEESEPKKPQNSHSQIKAETSADVNDLLPAAENGSGHHTDDAMVISLDSDEDDQVENQTDAAPVLSNSTANNRASDPETESDVPLSEISRISNVQPAESSINREEGSVQNNYNIPIPSTINTERQPLEIPLAVPSQLAANSTTNVPPFSNLRSNSLLGLSSESLQPIAPETREVNERNDVEHLPGLSINQHQIPSGGSLLGMNGAPPRLDFNVNALGGSAVNNTVSSTNLRSTDTASINTSNSGPSDLPTNTNDNPRLPHIVTTANNNPRLPDPVNPSHKAPIHSRRVQSNPSPFIPRKPYLNALPRKRPNPTPAPVSEIEKKKLGVSIGPQRPLPELSDQSNDNSAEIIDLTSD